MPTLFKKLHSERGTSVLIALLFFAICLTVGALILTAATASAAKTKDRYAEQQNYLAVASAARLLKNELGGHTYTAGQTWETWDTGETDPETGEAVTASAWEPITPYVTPNDAQNGDLLTDTYAVTGGAEAYTETFSLSADQGIPAVSVEFVMKVGGDAVFTLMGGDYTAAVTFHARTARVTDSATYDYRTTSWDTGAITKGAA